MPELIDRDAFEDALTVALSKILTKARRDLVDALYHEGFTQGELANVPPAIMQELRQDVTRELQKQIPPVFIDVMQQFTGLLSYAIDESRMQQAAQTWASTFIPELVTGMLDTTQTELRRIAQSAPDVQLERRILIGMLGTVALFGLARAITIARTTATEVNTAAEDAAMSDLEPIVQSIEEIWYTKRDERVCPDCLPMHDKVLSEGDKRPPLHPRCRCERKWKITYSDGTVAIVRASEETGKPVAIQ